MDISSKNPMKLQIIQKCAGFCPVWSVLSVSDLTVSFFSVKWLIISNLSFHLTLLHVQLLEGRIDLIERKFITILRSYLTN